ncbi:hypothetical protein GC163_11230 [bacterium]|nr:hypothetical protein [bacterium]
MTSYSRRAFLQSLGLSFTACQFLQQRLWAQDASSTTEKLPPVRAITHGPKFHWRGYYDKLLFDPTNQLVLANEVDFEGRSPTADDTIRVGMVDTSDHDRWIELGSSSAWNWQQGCMLQWVPGTASQVAWNDRDGDRFVSHILDVQTGKRRTLPVPFYCLSSDGQTAFAPDFRRLNDTRPGYGYAGIVDPNRDVLAPDDAGLWRINLQTGQQELIFSFADAAQIPYLGREEAAFRPQSKHWFNHLLCNPDGSRLFFLHRWHTPGFKQAFFTRAITINYDGSDPYVLDPHGGTSHFVWRDPQHIFAWAWHPSLMDRFYLYEDHTEHVTPVGPDVMTKNGHNTYVPGTDNTWVLNDTYPDAAGIQHPYLYHIPTNRRVPLGHFVSPREYRGEWRCDNHPSASRDGKSVVFDSPHADGRQVYLAEIGEIVHG